MTQNSKIVKVISIVLLLFVIVVIAFGCSGMKDGLNSLNEKPQTTEVTTSDLNPWHISRITPPIVESTAYVTTTVSTAKTSSVTTTSVTTTSVANSESSDVEPVPVQQEDVPVDETVCDDSSSSYVPEIVEEPKEEPVDNGFEIVERNVVEEPSPEPVVEESSTDDSWYYPELISYGAPAYFSYENQKILKGYCDQYGIDYELMLAVISVESGYKQYAGSGCGAIGFCQVMWITIEQFNIDTGIYYNDYYDANANLHVGVYAMYLSYKKFGNIYDACGGYCNGIYGFSAGSYSGYAETVTSVREQILALK